MAQPPPLWSVPSLPPLCSEARWRRGAARRAHTPLRLSARRPTTARALPRWKNGGGGGRGRHGISITGP
eukprot:4760172-Ditylum_brightwellii.AAC.1